MIDIDLLLRLHSRIVPFLPTFPVKFACGYPELHRSRVEMVRLERESEREREKEEDNIFAQSN